VSLVVVAGEPLGNCFRHHIFLYRGTVGYDYYNIECT
jgi:hypothetical protein